MATSSHCMQQVKMPGENYSHTGVDLPEMETEGKVIFSSTDFMGNFFEYEYADAIPEIKEPVVYVANYKAIGSENIISQLKTKEGLGRGNKDLAGTGKKRDLGRRQCGCIGS